MSHGGMTRDEAVLYKEYLTRMQERFVEGVVLLDQDDRDFLLDKIEESRWKSGPTYNEGVHILMDVVQYAVEAGYASPNMRFRK